MNYFYREVHVTGQENVPKEGPIIIASTHHNEIIDIAALAVTIPYRRHLCFWTKSSLFKNPIACAILSSSGSIPVQRNPNSTPPEESSSTPARSTLFRETTAALAAGQVVGVFPEGTSYTEHHIAQIKDGAAWAAIEYHRWKRLDFGQRPDAAVVQQDAMIIPVGIVYTDKSQYQSRVHVRYGKPLTIGQYADEVISSDTAVVRRISKKITAEIGKQMKDLTITSPDWDTFFAARMARKLLWDDDEFIPLARFVDISQTLVNILSPSYSDRTSLYHAREALITYYALLHHAGISHSSLVSLYPSNAGPPGLTRSRAMNVFFRQLATTLLHPRAIFFIPMLLIHLPAYLSGFLAARILSPDNEEESIAQYKVIFGGLSTAITYGTLAQRLFSQLPRLIANYVPASGLLKGGPGTAGNVVKNVIVFIMLTSGVVWISVKWHNALVGENYRQFRCLIASYKVFSSMVFPSSTLSEKELAFCSRPPVGPANPFLVQNSAQEHLSHSTKTSPTNGYHYSDSKFSRTEPKVSYRRLVKYVLAARVEAKSALDTYLSSIGDIESDKELRSRRESGACPE